MTNASVIARSIGLPYAEKARALAPGVFLAATIAFASRFVSERYGGPVMLYALLFGIAFNFLGDDDRCKAGIVFASKTVLRIGVALLGARITLGEVAALGAPTVILVVSGVFITITVGSAIGRILRLTPDHAVLSAGAVAICGASAALAISSVLPQTKNSERNTILTVVGVTTLSTLAMVIYPMIARVFDFTDVQAGIFLGATIHDVAQVIGAGYMISDVAGETAAIVKLMRVACLVPAVMVIALLFRARADRGSVAVKTPLLPVFLIGFVILMLFNSVGFVPDRLADMLGGASSWCLLGAVAALGVKTSLKDIVAVGPRPVAMMALQTLMLAAFATTGLCVISYLKS